MTTFALLSAAGLALASGTARLIIVLLGVDFFIASFAVGVGGTGWTLLGEVFPSGVRGRAAAIGAAVDWLANFLIIEAFRVWQSAVTLAGVLICFAALVVLAIAFIARFLPETEDRSVEEIIRLFEGKPAARQAAPR